MAKYYGDIPCANINNIVHITKSATQCFCEKEWSYSKPTNRNTFSTTNIIWRDLDAVTCEECVRKYIKIKNHSVL